MLSWMLKFLDFIGIDRAVAYTLTLRIWQIFAGLGTILFVTFYFSPVQQGFYYTFASVLALQVFFELGLTYVVLQFASHEKAFLEWTINRTLVGSETAKARLGALMRLTLRWYGVATVLMILCLIPLGLLFFGKSIDATEALNWQPSWILLVVTTACNLFLSPLFATLEGCGMVAEVAKYRTIQDISAYSLFWVSLYLGIGLLAIPVLQTTRLIISIIWLLYNYRGFIYQTCSFTSPGIHMNWWQEVWPMQWKIALSWLSGYFIFQLFNPLLFKYFGAIEAGKMGMSLSIAGALSTVCMAWVNTKIPTFGKLIALKKFLELDNIFLQSTKQAFFLSILGSIFLLSGLVILRLYDTNIANRVLPPIPFGLLLGVSIVNVIIFSEAAYLRAHKAEPFLWNSVIGAVLTTLICFLIGPVYGSTGMAAGYFILTATVGLSWATLIFISKRRAWHGRITWRN